MKRLARLLLVMVALWGGYSRAAIMTPSEFTQEFAASFRQARPGLKVDIVQDLQLKFASPNGEELTAFLDNAYATYKQNPEEKAGIIQKYIAALLERRSGPASGIDRTCIVPVIKDRPWLEEMRQALINRGAKKVPELVYEEFSPGLVIVYAQDSAKSIHYLTPAQLKQANIERGVLRSLACANLKRLLPKIECHGTNGFYMLTAGGNYESSLLLLDSIWRSGQMNVQGDMVVAIPARDLLWVTGSGSPQGIDKMKQMVKKASSESPYKLTSQLFVYRNGKFEEYK
jgi:uncharacterized protein YtpQ (UPF0354 family)